jgi:FkbM family methyltransferase
MGIRNKVRQVFYALGIPNVSNYIESSIADLKGSFIGSYAQHGEDLFVLEYFDGRLGFYLDIGANHPIKLSSTYLLYKRGWQGLTIEPIPHLSRLHKSFRQHDNNLNAAVGDVSGSLKFFEIIPDFFSTFDEDRANLLVKSGSILISTYDVEVWTLKDVCLKLIPETQIDFLTVDTESFDLQVLKGNDWTNIRPKLISCENGDSHDISSFMKSVGYESIKQLGCNTFFRHVQ